MNITYISYAAVPSYAAESLQIMKVCEAMMEEGHDVRLIAPARRTDPALRDVDVARHYGLRREIKPVYRVLPPTYLGQAWYALRGRLSSLGRIAYTRYGSCAAVCINAGARTVLELHGLPKVGSPADFVLKRLLRTQSRRLRVVTITDALRRMLAERYPFADSEKVIVAPDGVDTARFDSAPGRDEARRILNLPKDAPIVGHVGSLSPTNGVEILAKLISRMPEIHFCIVGDSGRGGALDYLKEVSRNSKTNGVNLTAPGQVPNSEVPLWMSACDILLLANQTPPGWENRNALWTSPLKLFEYMASGRLIIASDLPVIREVLDDETAFLVQSDDTGAWMKAIRATVKDPKRGKAIGEAARRKAKERYTWRARTRTALHGLENGHNHETG